MSASSERVPRLLALVPYLLARPGIPLREVAADFDVPEKQLRKDLELLWMCGLPGYGPGDLIDLSFEGDTVTVGFDAGMSRLSDTPGMLDAEAVQRAVAKIEAAVGQAQPAGVAVGLALREAPETAKVRDALQDGVRRGRALRLRYYTPSRDEITDRVVDPMRMLLVEGHSYLEAWCRGADGVRLFRLDRIDEVEVLEEGAAPPPHAQLTDTSEGLFRPDPSQRMAVLVLEPDARWIAEYYPVDDVIELGAGRARVMMRYADLSWMVRLALGLGGDVRVEHPAELADEVIRQSTAALRRAEHLPST